MYRNEPLSEDVLKNASLFDQTEKKLTLYALNHSELN